MHTSEKAISNDGKLTIFLTLIAGAYRHHLLLSEPLRRINPSEDQVMLKCCKLL